MRSRTWLLVAGATAVAGLLFAGCGASKGSDVPTSAATTSQSTAASSGQQLTVKLGDYSFTPSQPTAEAGNVTISAPNGGQIQHELVLLKTDKAAASLPQKGAEVDEDALAAQGVKNEGEITDVAPGQTKTNDYKLAPGHYVMICNIPGHYAQGMYGTLTVK